MLRRPLTSLAPALLLTLAPLSVRAADTPPADFQPDP